MPPRGNSALRNLLAFEKVACECHGGLMEAVIFVGPQGSGKTTFYKERFADTHVRISLDMLGKRSREQRLLKACLEGKQPFVIDNTNPQPTDRARYIGSARAAGFRVVAYYFETSLRNAIWRNNQRSGTKKIPLAGVAATFRKMRRPILAEGFDAVYVVAIWKDGLFRVAEDRPVNKNPGPTP